MSLYEATDNFTPATDSGAVCADSAMAEVFAGWDNFSSTASRQSSYITDGRSNATVLPEFGDLELFDSTVENSLLRSPDYTDSLTSSYPKQFQPSPDVSLDPIEFSGAAPINDGDRPGAIPDLARANSAHDQDVQKVFNDNFDRLDKDHDGFVSEKEIDRAMINPNFTGEDAALVAMLKEKQHELELLSNDEWFRENDGITRSDMAEFAKLQERGGNTTSEKDLVDSVETLFAFGQERIADSNHHLFADRANPLESIKPEAVRQGRINDCPFLADLAALANTVEGKQAITDMIHSNRDGTYTVTFPGAPDQPITVAAPTDSELAHYAGGSDCGTWAAVIEKAYGKYCDASNIVPQDGVPSGSPMPGFELLTGKPADRDIIEETPMDLTERKLKEAMEEGRPVTAVSRRAEDIPGDSAIQGSHAYSVLGYDPETHTIQLRNPWGQGEPVDEDGNPRDGVNDGVFTMTLEEFEKNFGRVIYSEK